MILVRTVFQVKWGKMDEVMAEMAQMRAIGESIGMGKIRVMTDLGGPMFTLVQEREVESIEQSQQQLQALFSNPEWQAMIARMTGLFESGRTEFYNIHDV